MKKSDIFPASILIITFVLVVVGFFISCGKTDAKTAVKIDTVFIQTIHTDTILVDRVNELDSLIKVVKQAQDSVKFYRDSVYYQNYINARRIEKIKYYIKICEKNSKNKKYFYGWIKRTMSE